MEIISLRNINFSYQPDMKVFSNLNFSVKKGEKIGIVGANGSGKTSFFYMIMGLIKPQSGEIVIYNSKRKTEKDFIEVRKRIGFLFQDPDDQLFAPIVEEDISFGPLNQGIDIQEVRKIVNDICNKLNITHLKQRITSKLSWGQKRLVSLAGILAMSPEVLILDEPTASIDEDVKENIENYLINSKKTLLITSHDEKFLNDTCQNIFNFKDSKFSLLKKDVC